MAKDLDALSFIMQNKGTAAFSIGYSAFDYYAGMDAYKQNKKALKQRADIYRTQADLQKSGIQVQTYLTRQAIERQAEENEINSLKAGANQVQTAASIGVSGSALTSIAANEAAKRARQSAVTEGRIQDAESEALRKLEQVDITTQQNINSMWASLSGKPSIIGSALKTTALVYKSYKDEVRLRTKADALAGAGKFGASFTTDIDVVQEQPGIVDRVVSGVTGVVERMTDSDIQQQAETQLPDQQDMSTTANLGTTIK